jgi:hypothetical protein
MREAVAPGVEDQGCREHQDAGNAEGQVWTVVLEQPGREQGGDEGPEIDGEVEPAEYAFEQVGVAFGELVADVGRHAGLDASRSDRD